MTSDLEIALRGVEDIRACAEMAWREWCRERGKRLRVEVTRRMVEGWIVAGLPTSRIGRGWRTAAPSEVRAWVIARLSQTGTAQSGQ